MESDSARLVLDGVVAPAVGVCVAAGAGWVAGVGPAVGLAAVALLAGPFGLR